MPIVSPPRIVGIDTVAHLLGLTEATTRRRLKRGDPVIGKGYLGKISNRHTWNMHELVSGLFVDESSIEQVVDRALSGEPPVVLCLVSDCENGAETIGLCRKHTKALFKAWKHAPSSTLIHAQLVGMCQWIVERNAHIVLPAGFDPWATVCMTPDCGNETNARGWHGPLCPSCAATFWRNSPDRPHPEWWNQAKGVA